MKILTINCGSSSIKYKLYDFPRGTLLSKGLIEHIGEKKSAVNTHTRGMEIVFRQLMRSGAIRSLKEIAAIGHRVVHGAEEFTQPRVINARVIKKIQECCKLAPLHNPANLAGIKAAIKVLPHVVQVAVFDTAFHQTIPRYAYMYALPLAYYHKYKIRKYGFHGTSHQFVAERAAQILKKPLSRCNLITCHLGNGCSISAIEAGKSIDTSMGFTPLEGLMMGTRSGDLDVAAVLYLMDKEKLSPRAIGTILNKKSGLLGISGVSNDVRQIQDEMHKGHRYARLALDMFTYRIQKYIGAYFMVLGRVDAVCFTAGIGENAKGIVRRLKKSITKVAGSKTKVLVIATNEERMIGSLTYALVKKRR